MATTLALSSGQQGLSQDGSRGLTAIFTLTPGTTATAGEDITAKLTPYFQSIDAIKVCGCSAVALYDLVIPVFQFTAGGLLASSAVTLFWMDDALAIDNATDLSAVATLQIEVTGKPA
jgi:hypothetical protein